MGSYERTSKRSSAPHIHGSSPWPPGCRSRDEAEDVAQEVFLTFGRSSVPAGEALPWIAGVVGGVGIALNNDSVAQVGTVSRMLLPSDGLWRGAMNAFQDPSLVATLPAFDGHPFLSDAAPTAGYLAWVVLWVALVLGLAGVAFQHRDL